MDFTVENAGTTIACREYVSPDVSSDAPALVCVHGACVDGVFFDGIARELARDYRVIAYDRRGCGESGDAADGRYDLAAQAAVAARELLAEEPSAWEMGDAAYWLCRAAQKACESAADALNPACDSA